MSARVTRLLDPGRRSNMDILPAIAAHHVESGTPEQRALMVFDDAATGTSAGIWDCTPWVGTMGPYSMHEFMILLEGSVTIDEPNGRSTTIQAGECFVIPKGLVCRWRQSDYVRKIFVIFEDPAGTVQPAGQSVIKLDTGAPLRAAEGPDPALVVGGRMPKWAEHVVHADVTGQWSVGLWSTTPYERRSIVFPRHELMHILSGRVTLGLADGNRQSFGAGDTVFVEHGALMSWHCDEPVTKIYCIVRPNTPTG